MTTLSKSYAMHPTGVAVPPALLADGPVGDDEVIHAFVTDDVDRSAEVMIPTGGDFGEFLRNPVVTWEHSDDDAKSYLLPIGTARTIALSADRRQLLSRTQFDMADPFAARVAGQVKRHVLRSWSVKFAPIEAGPPTAEEIRRRPDWARAKTIYRRWKLLAFSSVILPDNPNAVTIMKSLQEPSGAGADTPMPITEGLHVKVHKSMGGGCGVVKTLHTEGTHLGADDKPVAASHDEPVAEVEKHDAACHGTGMSKYYKLKSLQPFDAAEEAEEEEGDEPQEKPKPKAKALAPPPAEGATEGDGDGDEDADDEPKTPRVGHFVKFDNGSVRGVGKVVSVHKGELVPDVDDDVLGTGADPGVRIHVHKAMGDGHVPTALHIGCKMSQCAKGPALKVPSKAKAAAPVSKSLSDPPVVKVLAARAVPPSEILKRQAEWLQTSEGAAAVRQTVAEMIEKRSGAI